MAGENLGRSKLGRPNPAEPLGHDPSWRRSWTHDTDTAGVDIPERGEEDPNLFQVEGPDPEDPDQADDALVMTERHRRAF